MTAHESCIQRIKELEIELRAARKREREMWSEMSMCCLYLWPNRRKGLRCGFYKVAGQLCTMSKCPLLAKKGARK